ncbi:unnamed protein product, partial [Ixodes hexagonus]
MVTNDPAPGAPPQLEALAIRLSPFWPADPQVWCAQVDPQFVLRRIIDQNTKFYHVCALPSAGAPELRGFIIAPPSVNTYDVIKDELLRRTGLWEQRRLQRLLTSEELGDKTPSQLLRRMRQSLASATIDDALFRQLCLQHLPNNVRMMLASADSATVEDLAKLAAGILDASNPS